jgi:hypothetical protein
MTRFLSLRICCRPPSFQDYLSIFQLFKSCCRFLSQRENFKSILDRMIPEEADGTGKRRTARMLEPWRAFGATSSAVLEDVGGSSGASSEMVMRRHEDQTSCMPYPQGVTRDKMVLQLKACLVKFFLSQTYIVSGSKRDTRSLGISKSEPPSFPSSCGDWRGNFLIFWPTPEEAQTNPSSTTARRKTMRRPLPSLKRPPAYLTRHQVSRSTTSRQCNVLECAKEGDESGRCVES